jgi:hypothetical protein
VQTPATLAQAPSEYETVWTLFRGLNLSPLPGNEPQFLYRPAQLTALSRLPPNHFESLICFLPSVQRLKFRNAALSALSDMCHIRTSRLRLTERFHCPLTKHLCTAGKSLKRSAVSPISTHNRVPDSATTVTRRDPAFLMSKQLNSLTNLNKTFAKAKIITVHDSSIGMLQVNCRTLLVSRFHSAESRDCGFERSSGWRHFSLGITHKIWERCEKSQTNITRT